MKRKVTYTTEEVRMIIEMDPIHQKAVLEKTEEMSQLSVTELKNYKLNILDPRMLHAIRAKMLKRAESAERRRKRKEQKEAAAKQQAEEQEKQQASQPAHYDSVTLRCAVTVANLFNGGVAFRDHSYHWANEADDKFKYEMQGTMKCIEKIVRRLLKQSSRTEREGLRQLMFHRLQATAAECIARSFAESIIVG